ncbi:MAG: hypothetical protein NZZ41_06680 [Candidatus Dojkabacteria bacterium]|nr:hypothetical protein [Candidatus Dojkabacteria bacterium]
MQSLPNKILCEIKQHLSFQDFKNLGATWKKFKEFFNDEYARILKCKEKELLTEIENIVIEGYDLCSKRVNMFYNTVDDDDNSDFIDDPTYFENHNLIKECIKKLEKELITKVKSYVKIEKKLNVDNEMIINKIVESVKDFIFDFDRKNVMSKFYEPWLIITHCGKGKDLARLAIK